MSALGVQFTPATLKTTRGAATVKDTARKCGIKAPVWKALEAGKATVTMTVASRIAAALGDTVANVGGVARN